MKEGKVLYASLVFTVAICILLLVIAAVWGVWIQVMPALWPDGPVGITQPDYLVFVGSMLLTKVCAVWVRGSGK